MSAVIVLVCRSSLLATHAKARSAMSARKTCYLALDGDDLRALPLSMRKTNLARLLARRTDGIFTAQFE
jgi:ATP-dependent DNA ligase